jgi:hypothetical protein
VTLALLCGPDLLIVVLAHHGQPKSGDLVTALLVGIGLATLFVTLAALLDSRRGKPDTGDLSLAGVANHLAVAVGAQWAAEAAVRRLNDPYPLPVSWTAADASLTDGWDVLVKLATSGAGWPSPPPPSTWAYSPDDLAGGDGQFVDVLARVPTGRLVVLGEPGSGKTMLMVRLVLDLLKDRVSGGPVPMLVSVASWNPEDQDLHGWLAAQLSIDHPALASPTPPGARRTTRGQVLLAAGMILPILDGLDEIPDAVRGPAISRINDTLHPGERLVVTCRTRQYRDALRPPGGAEVTLRAAAAIQLRPLNADVVSRYLRDDAGGPGAAARWEPVLAALRAQQSAGQALATPLMVGLARTIYNPRPGELAGELRDPAELCSSALPDRAAVETHLFDAFIPAAYRHGTYGRWTAEKAETCLVRLARHLEYTIGGPDLAWWQLVQALPGAVVGLAFGLATGLALGFFLEPAFGLAAGFAFGAAFGLAFGLARGLGFSAAKEAISKREMRFSTRVLTWLFVSAAPTPSRKARFISTRGLRHGIAVGVTVGVMGGFAFGAVFGLVFGLTFGVITGLGLGFEGIPSDLATATSPRTVLRRDRRAALGLSIGTVLICWPLLALLTEFAVRAEVVVTVTIGLVLALILGLVTSVRETAWPLYGLVRGWLALRHRLPWQLMGFFDDAHQRGVLRQAGAVYQFRHIELQHRLATRP